MIYDDNHFTDFGQSGIAFHELCVACNSKHAPGVYWDDCTIHSDSSRLEQAFWFQTRETYWAVKTLTDMNDLTFYGHTGAYAIARYLNSKK